MREGRLAVYVWVEVVWIVVGLIAKSSAGPVSAQGESRASACVNWLL